jgi:hypothetical protein
MEDNIRNLCTKLLATEDDRELSSVLIELQKALHHHIERVRSRLADYPFVVERRASDTPPRTPTRSVRSAGLPDVVSTQEKQNVTPTR